MPNVLLTQSCVRSCPYCFARKHMSESSPGDVLSWENLIYLADFFHVAGERHFRLLGGEPALHPDFNDMLVYLLERGFDLSVFTSGVMADRVLEEAVSLFGNLPPERLTFICNLNDPGKTRTPMAETESVKRFLRAFGERVVPGFNIYRTDFELDFLLQLVCEFGLRREIRLGIAHPIPGKRNLHIAIADMPGVIDRIFSYGPIFERLQVLPGLDCGFPLCRFTDSQLAWLYRFAGGKPEFCCGPVVDIGPDMNVWACFPLGSLQKRSVFEFNSMAEMMQFYSRLHDSARVEAGGIYLECDTCGWRELGTCRGGCIAHSIVRFQEETPVRVKEVYL